MRTEDRSKAFQISEQELDEYTERLIRRTEADGLIPAPVHMKQEILERSRHVDYQLRVQTQELPKKLSKELQFFLYSLKVGAAVVTALFLVLMVPRELPDIRSGTELPAVQEEETLGARLNQGMRAMDRMLRSVNLYLNEK